MNAQTNYIQSGNSIKVIEGNTITNTLMAGVYALSFDQMTGFSLKTREDFELPAKIYNETALPDRILNTFNTFDKRGLGVLLTGPKGTGKTIEAKITCTKSNMPIIIIASSFVGGGFQEFIESVKTPSVIFIDEFEKVYSDMGDRNEFLTIMDGVAKSRHLFLLTSNDEKIGEFFESRPGRIRYHKSYAFLDDETITVIVHDKLQNKSIEKLVLEDLYKISDLSIDSLVCIIDECNIYNEAPRKFLPFFNVKSTRAKWFSGLLTTIVAVPKSTANQGDIDSAYNFNYQFAKTGKIGVEVNLETVVLKRAEYRVSMCMPFHTRYVTSHEENLESLTGMPQIRVEDLILVPQSLVDITPNELTQLLETGVIKHALFPAESVEAVCGFISCAIENRLDVSVYVKNIENINWSETTESYESFDEDRRGFTAIAKNGSVLRCVKFSPQSYAV